MKKFLFLLIWFFSLIIASFYTYEHPEDIERIIHYVKMNQEPDVKLEKSNIQKTIANSFSVEFSKVISLSKKTAFIVHDEKSLKFNKKDLKIYTQNGYLIKNLKSEKLNLPGVFTTQRNGGIKTIFIYNNNEFALISATKTNCFYASIVSLNNGKELFKTKCLTGSKKETDFNGLGSSNIHHKNKILLSIGAPEQGSSKIRVLAQDDKSIFGKIIEINKNDIDKIISGEKNNLDLKIFSMGHRNPQRLAKINDSFFSVEHGPLGGDELNKIIKGKNYGWPAVSYGTQYLYDESGKSFEISHEDNAFEEPLFALVPGVGISGLNNCPTILKKFYKKPCLLALSLFGNNLRPGKSIIIFLLNNKMNQVHSVEQIYLKKELLFRHFVTNSKNELYEDENGSIYISADKKGIYKISFIEFRN